MTGLLLMATGPVAWITLAIHHHPAGGAADGGLLLVAGFLLARIRR